MTPCLEWQRARSSAGYGQLQWRGKVRYAHRVIWEVWFGPIPERVQVLHRCDNPSCFRPDHLFLGTQKDNMADMDRKGRRVLGGIALDPVKLRTFWNEARARGIKVGRKRRLSEDQLVLVRGWIKEGITQTEAAKRLGVSQSVLSISLRREVMTYPVHGNAAGRS